MIKTFKNPLTLLALVICLFVFLKNAWVTDDAYILFRSLEQLYVGNGPTWNPHERVQVYTSPLWYFLLAIFRLFTNNYYLNTIILSLLLWIATLLIIRILLQDNTRFFIASLILVGSNGFYDYTSSGLENILGYLLLSLFLLFYLRLFSDSEESLADRKNVGCITIVMFLFGLLILVRHDLVTLLLPAMIYLVYLHWSVFSVKKWIGLAILAFLPFVVFTIFAVIYYGFPLPNTAYAKVFNGIEKIELIKQGFRYLYVTLRYDPLTFLIIFSASIIILFMSKKNHLRFLILGVILNLVYIISVGGDFMQGRFLSYSFLVSLFVLIFWMLPAKRSKWNPVFAFSIVGLYLLFYPHTPINSPLDYRNQDFHLGITDERGFYFDSVSLYSYLNWNPETQLFPRNSLSQGGREFKRSHQSITIEWVIGFFGFYAGTDKIIIDPLALADPLLARLPAEENWRIGHFERELPEGYFESVSSSQNLIEDPQLHEVYEKLKVITQSDDLFSSERLKLIIRFNFGGYNYLLPGN